MKSTIQQFFCGKENRLNGLIALGAVSLIVLGCTCSLSNPWQKENNSTSVSNTFSPPPDTNSTPAKDSPVPTPTIAKTPVSTPPKISEPPPPPANIPQPVEVAYIHFLNQLQRDSGGNLKIGSPKRSGTRIEVRAEANGETETLVVMQKTNDGHKATVIVGPKDAGAVRIYTLTLQANGWKISSFKDLDG